MFARLKQSADRYHELEQALADPDVHGQPVRMQSMLREMGALRSQAECYERWAELEDRRLKATEMLDDSDAELCELAREELEEVGAALEQMTEDLKREVADDDPNRGRAVMLEVRAGTGGDEATLFAGDLVRLYTRFAEQHGLKLEVLTSHPSEVGGYKEIVLSVAGPDAWDLFRFEAGGHRVQRVPATETQGRIHTSAATVAVLPEAEEVDVEIQESDLRIDTYRSSGPGGQNVNKTSSAIRITHEPTGTVVQCQDESSQHKNKARAMRMLRSRIRQAQEEASKAAVDASRRTQVGSGDRSERVRTYNFPQNRVTDHRIKTSYSLETVMLGNLRDIVEDLRRRDLEEKIAALTDGGEQASTSPGAA